MKLNGTPRHYMPLSQSQSDDEENVSKIPKYEKESSGNLVIHNSFTPQLYMITSSCQNSKCLSMSPFRTLAFILSLGLCVLFIVTIVFLMPCEPATEKSLLQKWNVILQNICVTSDITIAKISAFSSPLLIFGYSKITVDAESNYGIIALRKTDGNKKWQLDLHFEVTSVLCNSIDVNGDGSLDCLVIGKTGQTTAVDVKTGNNLWYLHSHKTKIMENTVSVPTILSDCNSDFIPELAVSCANLMDEKFAFMGLISGGTGEVIGSLVPIPHCNSPIVAHVAMNWKNRTAFVFYCIDSSAGNLFLSYAEDFCDLALNRTDHMKIITLYRSVPSYSKVQFYKVSENELAVVLNGTKCIMLQMTSNGTLKHKWIKWIAHFKDNLFWRAVTHGHFIPGEDLHLILISDSNSGSKAMGLKIRNGSKMFSSPFRNSTITSAFTLPNFFRDVDGIILKMIISVQHSDLKHMESNVSIYNRSISDADDKRKIIADDDNNFQTAEECYILLHRGGFHQFTKISVHEIFYLYNGDTWQPNIFTEKNTAIATVLNNEEVDLAIVSTSILLNDNLKPSEIQTSANLLKLEKFSQFSKCIYKSCSW